MISPMPAVAAPNASTELLQQLIRLECVNTGQPDSGDETRAAELLRAVVDVPGVDVQSFGPLSNRQSLVARLPGTDPTAPIRSSQTLVGSQIRQPMR